MKAKTDTIRVVPEKASRLPKPKSESACTGCGFCCASQPCALAEQVLGCKDGPCSALEWQGSKSSCGLVRNPLGYMWAAAHPGAGPEVLDQVPASEEAWRLSTQIASALGLGAGCDAADDDESRSWAA